MASISITETVASISVGPIQVGLIVEPSEPSITIGTNDGPAISVASTESLLTIGEVMTETLVVMPEVNIVAVAEQGPQGIPGESGSSSTEYVAGETISALKVVAIIDDEAFVADSSDMAHAGRIGGIAITSATTGNTLDVRSAGQITDASWSWPTGGLLFFNSSGVLTLTPPSSGFTQPVGRVESADTIFVELFQPIERG